MNIMRSTVTVVSIFATLGIAVPAMAQDQSSNPQQAMNEPELGRITQGNTTIIFAPADSSDLDLARLKTWEEFADSHPAIARDLAHHPSLMHNQGYLKRHPDLVQFFKEHPDIKVAMAQDPGNFVAPPPRSGE